MVLSPPLGGPERWNLLSLSFVASAVYNSTTTGQRAAAKVTHGPGRIVGLCSKGDFMSIIAWIILGLIAGFIGSKIVNKSGDGIIVDLLLGIVGAVVGGFLFRLFGAHGVTGLNLYSLLVAVIGAIVFLLIYHALFRRRASA